MAEDLGSLIAKLGADLTDLKRGLLEGKAQFAGFQQMIESGAAKVKEVLAFAGIGLGIYEIVSKLKEFGASILEVGGKSEVLRATMYALGQHYQISGQALDLYIQKLKDAGIEQERALQAVNSFMKAGLSIADLPQLADAARVLGASMGLPLQEAFSALVSGIVKGTPKQLAEMVPGIKEVLQSMSSDTKKLLDSTILSGTEKSEILLNAVLAMADKAKGAVNEVSESYFAQLNKYKVKVAEVKEALFEFIKPIAVAVTQEEIQTWEDLYGAIGNNRQALRDLGEVGAVLVGRVANFIRTIVSFAAANKDLLVVLLELKAALKVVGWFSIAEGAAGAATAVGGLRGELAALRLALAGPWGLIIAVSVVGIYQALKQIDSLAKYHAEYLGGAEWIPSEEIKDQAKILADAEAIGKRLEEAQAKIATMSPFERTRKGPALTEAEARTEAEGGAKKGKSEHALPPGTGKGGGGEADKLLGEYLKMLEAKRRAEIQEAQTSLELLKATDEKKQAELRKSLAEGLIDGQTYYLRLQELHREETNTGLALIAKKKAAQEQAYREELATLQQKNLTPEALEIAQQKLAAENRQSLAKLDVEAAKLRLDNEKKITEELIRQVDLRRQYKEKTEDLNLEANQLLGIITEQEGKLQRLYLDWQRAKDEALRAGAYSPEYAAALERSYTAKVYDSKYGGMFGSIGSEFTSGISNLINSIRQGTMDIGKTLVDMFNNIMMAVLKPGFDALGQALTSALKWLLNSLSASLGGGSLFGGGEGGGGDYSYLSRMLSSIPKVLGEAHGGAFHQGLRLAFAGGGILTRPTLFPMAGGLGLAGEAGYEGILPLARIGGDLGVKALLPKAGPAQVNIINKNLPEITGTAQQNDDGSIDVYLERKVLGMVANGPVHNLIKAIK